MFAKLINGEKKNNGAKAPLLPKWYDDVTVAEDYETDDVADWTPQNGEGKKKAVAASGAPWDDHLGDGAEDAGTWVLKTWKNNKWLVIIGFAVAVVALVTLPFVLYRLYLSLREPNRYETKLDELILMFKVDGDRDPEVGGDLDDKLADLKKKLKAFLSNANTELVKLNSKLDNKLSTPAKFTAQNMILNAISEAKSSADSLKSKLGELETATAFQEGVNKKLTAMEKMLAKVVGKVDGLNTDALTAAIGEDGKRLATAENLVAVDAKAKQATYHAKQVHEAVATIEIGKLNKAIGVGEPLATAAEVQTVGDRAKEVADKLSNVTSGQLEVAFGGTKKRLATFEDVDLVLAQAQETMTQANATALKAAQEAVVAKVETIDIVSLNKASSKLDKAIPGGEPLATAAEVEVVRAIVASPK